MKLWKYNKRSGYYDLQRDVSESNANEWLNLFQKDEPNEEFVLSVKRPVKKSRFI